MPDDGSLSSAQIVYFSHGGGPLPILGDPGHRAMVEFMTALPGQLRRPDAIVVVSAHWEERSVAILGSPRPPMFYDYYGFPEQAYSIQYPAAGSPQLAGEIKTVLDDAGFGAQLDLQRGFDHGLFIPLKMMYPDADIPCLQISLVRGLNPSLHISLGRALGRLKDRKLLVIGSGFSFHNMQAFAWGGAAAPDRANDAFQDWLIQACTDPMGQAQREERLMEWEKAPSARYCHPREEHLLPLHVCAGMAGQAGKLLFDDAILGKRSVAFLWEVSA